MTEKSIVDSIMAHIRKQPGCFCWKEHGGMYGTAGLPDIVCCHGGLFVCFEVKAPAGRATALQELTHARICKAGGRVYVVRSLREAESILDDLRGWRAVRASAPPRRPAESARRSLEAAYARLRSLPAEEQRCIAETYYKGEMPWALEAGA